MNKKDQKVLKEIKARLDNCIDLYVDLFCKKQEVWFDSWVGDLKGGLAVFGDLYITFEDIRLDLEQNTRKGLVFKWYWDNVENQDKAINYYSYIKGLRIKDINPVENPFTKS